jgi:hypothetical protein
MRTSTDSLQPLSFGCLCALALDLALDLVRLKALLALYSILNEIRIALLSLLMK